MNGLPLSFRVRKQRLARLAVAWLGAIVVGCSGRHAPQGGSTDGGGRATEEPVLNIYNWADYIGHDTVAEFERRTHIKVVYEFYDSNETLETKLMSGQSGYDIVSTTTGFYGRQIKAGAYLALDRGKLTNWGNLDPVVLALQAEADPGNRHAVPYLHAMNGIAYNVDLVKKRLPQAPLDSLAMIFDPAVIAKFADCGVTFLDSPEDVIQLALAYLHLDPNSQRADDLQAAERVLMAVRPFIRTFNSTDYYTQLATNEICVAIAWSSDYYVAQQRAREDGTGAHLAFILPKEGSNITYNALLIPASAPHPDAAHKFLNFILEPRVIAQITNDIHYGNDNLAARPFVDPAILADPNINPPADVRARLYLPRELGAVYDRLRTRVWTRIKTGQ
jgi:putrescine transport system substrate-binding protein